MLEEILRGQDSLLRQGKALPYEDTIEDKAPSLREVFYGDSRYSRPSEDLHNLTRQLCRLVNSVDPLALLNYLRAACQAQTAVSDFAYLADSKYGYHALALVQSILFLQRGRPGVKKDLKSLERIRLKSLALIMESMLQDLEHIKNERIKQSDNAGDSLLLTSQLDRGSYGRSFPLIKYLTSCRLLAAQADTVMERYGMSTEQLRRAADCLSLRMQNYPFEEVEFFASYFRSFGERIRKTAAKLNYSVNDPFYANFLILRGSLELIEDESFRYVVQTIYQTQTADDVEVESSGFSPRFAQALSCKVGGWESTGEGRWHEQEGLRAFRSLPVIRKPFIEINGRIYSFNLYNFCDGFYDFIRHDITSDDYDLRYQWNWRQGKRGEDLAVRALQKLLPGAVIHRNVIYEIQNSVWAKYGPRRKGECDLIVEYGDCLLAVEVKAMSHSSVSPLEQHDVYANLLKRTITKGAVQAMRVMKYLNNRYKCEFYELGTGESIELKMSDYPIRLPLLLVTESPTAVLSQISRFREAGVDSSCSVITFEDLEIMSCLFTSPLMFIHYLECRKRAARVRSLSKSDENLQLGCYFDSGDYSYEQRLLYEKALARNFAPEPDREEDEEHPEDNTLRTSARNSLAKFLQYVYICQLAHGSEPELAPEEGHEDGEQDPDLDTILTDLNAEFEKFLSDAKSKMSRELLQALEYRGGFPKYPDDVKPKRELHRRVEEILHFLDGSTLPWRVSAAFALLDQDNDTLMQLGLVLAHWLDGFAGLYAESEDGFSDAQEHQDTQDTAEPPAADELDLEELELLDDLDDLDDINDIDDEDFYFPDVYTEGTIEFVLTAPEQAVLYLGTARGTVLLLCSCSADGAVGAFSEELAKCAQGIARRYGAASYTSLKLAFAPAQDGSGISLAKAEVSVVQEDLSGEP